MTGWLHFFFLHFSFQHTAPLLHPQYCKPLIVEQFFNSSLTSWDRRSQIKAVEINANGRIELVGKNFGNRSSTWPWAYVCVHNTVRAKPHSQQPGQRFVGGFQAHAGTFIGRHTQTSQHRQKARGNPLNQNRLVIPKEVTLELFCGAFQILFGLGFSSNRVKWGFVTPC